MCSPTNIPATPSGMEARALSPVSSSLSSRNRVRHGATTQSPPREQRHTPAPNKESSSKAKNTVNALARTIFQDLLMAPRMATIQPQGRCGAWVRRSRHECCPQMTDRLVLKPAVKKPPPEAGALVVMKPRSLGVGNAAILQSCLVTRDNDFLLVILLAAIGQGHLWFLRNPGPRSLAW